MKKYRLILILSALIVSAGLLAKPYSKLVCLCMVLGGLIVFFGALGAAVLNQGVKRCLSCGRRIYVNAAQTHRVRSGLIQCPGCGSLVRVDHVTPRE